MESRNGAIEYSLQAIQDAQRCEVGTVATTANSAIRSFGDCGFRERANWHVAGAHNLFPPRFVFIAVPQHLCRSVDGRDRTSRAARGAPGAAQFIGSYAACLD